MCSGDGEGGERKILKLGMDTSVLVASVKRRGEKFHSSALQLSDIIKDRGLHGVASSLTLIELPGALASTAMPVEKIFEVESSIQENFNLSIPSYEEYIDKTVELVMEFRDLKRSLKIGAADFHHLATSIKERCEFFVTVDENHLLRPEVKQALQKYVAILNPDEALKTLMNSDSE